MKRVIHLGLVILVLGSCSSDKVANPDPDPAPLAGFTASATTVEEGSSVTFDNASLNATSYLWLFPGGDPNTSAEENPTITYHTPGSFSASLTALNEVGDDATLTIENYITVEAAPIASTATYEVTFKGNWNATNHPADFPAGDHFSPAVGMVHKPGTVFFEEGALASAGMETMAETGATAELRTEIDALVSSGLAASSISGEGLTTGFSEANFQITVTDDFPLVTLVSMIAPSPDWFIAVENVSLSDHGIFVDDLTIDANSFDSGTDNGATFTSANADADPSENIAIITGPPLGNGTTINPPMAVFTFVKVNN